MPGLKFSPLPGKRGELRLRLGLKNGRTIIKEVYNQVPLKVAKPFYLEPGSGEIFIYQMNPAGGMVQGDNYYQTVELEKGAQAFLTTQSATKIYRSQDSSAGQFNVFKVGEEALLEYFPDPVIPFAGSRFVNETEIHLAAGATAFVAEIVTPGRVRRGETFKYEFYRSKTKAFWEGEIILWDNWLLMPEQKDTRSLGGFEDYTHQGNLFMFSEKVEQNLVDQLHEKLTGLPQVLAGASLTVKNGIAIRLLGYRAVDVENAVMIGWDLARQELIGRSKPRIRKY